MSDRPCFESSDVSDRPLTLLNLRLELLKLSEAKSCRLGDRLHRNSLLEEIERDRASAIESSDRLYLKSA